MTIVTLAHVTDSADVARLLYAFNTEFSDPTPGVPALTQRIEQLLDSGEMTVLLTGERPVSLALFRLRCSKGRCGWLARAGAVRMDLGTGETDTVARALYESCGFSNREGGPDKPLMMFYERDL